VRIALYTIGGKLIKVLVDRVETAGEHACQWDGNNSSFQTVAAGVNVLVAQVGEYRDMKKVVVIR